MFFILILAQESKEKPNPNKYCQSKINNLNCRNQEIRDLNLLTLDRKL